MNWHQACELPYYHGSDLGANPTVEGTTFKLWAPTACVLGRRISMRFDN